MRRTIISNAHRANDLFSNRLSFFPNSLNAPCFVSPLFFPFLFLLLICFYIDPCITLSFLNLDSDLSPHSADEAPIPFSLQRLFIQTKNVSHGHNTNHLSSSLYLSILFHHIHTMDSVTNEKREDMRQRGGGGHRERFEGALRGVRGRGKGRMVREGVMRNERERRGGVGE